MTPSFTCPRFTDDLYVPASNGNSVGVLESHDGGDSTEYDSGVGATVEAAILMATGANGEDGSVVVGGLAGAGYSLDHGATWAKLGGLRSPAVITQDIKYEAGSGLWALTGSFLGVSGIASSPSADTNFTVTQGPQMLIENELRYGSLPTKDTWYVTAGFWGDDGVDMEPGFRRVSKGLALGPKGEAVNLLKAPVGIVTGTPAGSRVGSSFAWGQVAKTVDAGRTWSLVFNDTDSGLYPNDISCFDARTCVFVLDASGTDLPARIMSTVDGGASWETFETTGEPGDGLMAARMVGPTEAWVSGGNEVGEMWHTTDLVHWDVQTVEVTDAASIFSFALIPDGSGIYATGILRSQLCSVLKIDF